MKATLKKIHHETTDIITFWFEPEKPVDYIAGQFIEMSLPHPQPDERGTKHWFTLSSSPTDSPFVSITTKFAERSSTFKAALRNLNLGDGVTISEPMGDFVLPKNSSIPLVFVAGGIGITPFHSIIKWLIDTRQARELTFIYAVNNEHEMVFQKLFEHYGMNRIIVANKPDSAWDGETGRLTAKRILDLAKPTTDTLIYVSGPEPMVETLDNDLENAGIPKARLVGDFFPGYRSI
ncbi:MAG TPA: FAD-dependent oxidoreductase [Candidatus Saccharimonadales bacterium]|nr:FAD-dependent oxidoreductase [Candidatus Saccharimonadales bacterium]